MSPFTRLQTGLLLTQGEHPKKVSVPKVRPARQVFPKVASQSALAAELFSQTWSRIAVGFRRRKTAFNKPEMKAQIREGGAAAEARSSDNTPLIYALQVCSSHQGGEPSNFAKIYSQRPAGLILPGGAADTHTHSESLS